MEEMSNRELVHRYYEAWAYRDKDAVRAAIADDLAFRSPQDRFDDADGFLDACWIYAQELASVRFVKEIYDGDEAFVALTWRNEDGKSFSGAEYLKVASGKIREILVINNGPAFGDLLE